MTDFLIYDAKVAVLIAIFYMFYRLVLARETFHRVNRLTLLLTAIASFVLPLCVITLHKTVTVEAVPMVSVGDVQMEVAADAGPEWWQLLLPLIFIIGVVVTLGHTLMSMFRILMLIKRSEKHPQPDGITICVTDNGQIQPFSWMHYIVMDRRDYEDGNPAILAHERGHIRLRHSWDLLLVDTLTALQWFNPAMWMLRQDLRAIHEYEADGEVLSLGINARQYQYLLIAKAASIGGYSLANGISHSTLKNRINMMLHKKSNQTRLFKLLALVPIVAVALAVNAEKVQDVVYADASGEPTIETMIADALENPEVAPEASAEKEAVTFRTVFMPENSPIAGIPVKVVENGHNICTAETADNGLVTVNAPVGSTVKFTLIDQEKDVKVTKEMLAKGGVQVVTFGESDEVVKIKVHVTAKEDGSPIVGAVAQIAGTKKGSVSDFDGNFTLEANVGSRVEVSYVGYDTKNLTVKKGSSQNYEVVLTKESADGKVYDVVDQMPQFPGGPSKLFEYLARNVRYPAEAEKAGIQGRVIVSFVVEKDGSVSNAKTVKAIHPALDEEALRVINSMPNWTPGKKNGEATRVKYTVPVTFRLQGKDAEFPQYNGTLKYDGDAKVEGEVIVVGYGDQKPNASDKAPYIIVDGKPIDNAKLKEIDPKTIDRMDVLKDKAAIEKYGEKAKDGVIVITTKKSSK